jgi:hypothetical protein
MFFKPTFAPSVAKHFKFLQTFQNKTGKLFQQPESEKDSSINHPQSKPFTQQYYESCSLIESDTGDGL